MSDFVTEVERTARKTHVCWVCTSTILPGDRYTVTAFSYEGSVRTNKRCKACDKFLHDFLGWVGDWFFDDDLFEYADAYPDDPEVIAWRKRRGEPE